MTMYDHERENFVCVLVYIIFQCACHSEKSLLCLLYSSCLSHCLVNFACHLRDLLLQDPVKVEGLEEDFSELGVLPSVNNDIDTGVENKEQVGDIGKN